MFGINHIRAHVLHHSSAALKINKPELAKSIIAVKQKKLDAMEYLSYKKEPSNAHQKRMKYHENMKRCDELITKNNFIKTYDCKPLPLETAELALDTLLETLKHNNDFIRTEGVFRISPTKKQFDETSLSTIMMVTKGLELPTELISSKIKGEILSVIMDSNMCNDLIAMSYDFNLSEGSQKPNLEKYPAFNRFICFLKEFIVANKEYNKMDEMALKNTLAMMTTKNLPLDDPNINSNVKNLSKMYTDLLKI
ncbi:MAG: hypothetical protein ACRCRU_00555 [Vibrio sp.]|uniref:hypothetical protein n=1 Tax=Vibrio sp. TaxID=678 RepID=UPI003F2EB306